MDQFEITVHHCNGDGSVTQFTDVTKATTFYAERLAEMFDPPVPDLHVQLVVMHLMDTNNHIIHTVDSGIFACEHTAGP
jgi:hypothetical protein